MTGRPIASMADVAAIELSGWPLDVPASTYDLIKRGAALNPEAPALSFFLSHKDHNRPETWTYAQLLEEITRTANGLHHLGAEPDTVIAYVLPNLPETHFVIWGAQAAGVVFAINPMLDADAIRELLKAAGATMLVTLAPSDGFDLWAKVCDAVQESTSVRDVITINLADRVRGPVAIAVQELRDHHVPEEATLHGIVGNEPALPSGMRMHDFARLCAAQPADHLVSGRISNPEDFSSYFCTGGTTGLPKIAMRRHRNEVANALSAGYVLDDIMTPGRNVFCGLPLFHVNAVLITGLVPFSRGAHVVLGPPLGYRAEGVIAGFWEIVEHHRINFFSGVPTLYAALLEHPTTGHDLSSLEYGLCGAAPLPVEVMRKFEEATGVRILEGYGLTEGTCVSSSNPPHGERRPGSIGIRVPFQQMKSVILDDDGNYVRDCLANEVGALVIAGPNVFAGYKIKGHNVGLWVDAADGTSWLNTGDLGRQDEDGYFWLAGRKKELIIRGGHNIDPALIEQALYRHPSVQYAAAVGRPDARAGELPVAYVQLKHGAAAEEADLLEFAKAHIGEPAARPKVIRIIAEIPQTAVGKIFKPALVRREIEDALATELASCGVFDFEVSVDTTPEAPFTITVRAPDGAQAKAALALGRFAYPYAVFALDRRVRH